MTILESYNKIKDKTSNQARKLRRIIRKSGTSIKVLKKGIK